VAFHACLAQVNEIINCVSTDLKFWGNSNFLKRARDIAFSKPAVSKALNYQLLTTYPLSYINTL